MPEGPSKCRIDEVSSTPPKPLFLRLVGEDGARSAKLDLRIPRNREDAFAQVRTEIRWWGFRRGVFLGRPLPPPLLAEANRLRQLLSSLGVVGRDHRIIGSQTPLLSILPRGKASAL